MAGSNVVFKKGDVVFKEGDAADGMYVIRKGSLEVYLTKDGHHVSLASIGAGGMIGEMAFFDKKPRSASVRAADDSEVTKITPDDFAALMKQIPKWFVSIMSSLSTRLRETNERLQKVENKTAGAKGPFEDVMKIFHLINLLLKDATKEGKYFCLVRKVTEQRVVDIFNLAPDMVKKFFDCLVEQKLITIAKDNYNNDCLAFSNKAIVGNVVKYVTESVKEHGATCVTGSAADLLECVKALAEESAYETVNISFDDAVTEGEKRSFTTAAWKDDLKFFKKPTDAVSLVKMTNGVGFKVNRKEVPQLISFIRVMVGLKKAGVA